MSFFRFTLMKNMTRYPQRLTYTRYSTCMERRHGKREQNSPRKQMILWFCGPRRSILEEIWKGMVRNCYQKTSTLDSSDVHLWMVSNTNIEANLYSAAIHKFSSKNRYSNADLYKVKMWLVGSLLLEICTVLLKCFLVLLWFGHVTRWNITNISV